MARYKIIILATCLIPLVFAELQVIDGKIKITTGTGSFCPHTVDFVSQQLAPTYEKYGQFLDIEFIAWGRETLNEDGSVTCNRGTNDCWANRLHRCVLDLLKDDQAAQMKYMNCEFSDRAAFLLGSYACVQEVGLNLVIVDYCLSNPRRDTLDAVAAAAIAPTLEVLNAVPSVVFNDRIDEAPGLYNDARNRLRSMVCFALADVPETGVSGCSLA
ncbi:GILT-like protein 1 [Plodia interpunctella]|uniref:GILT-like protein 1 n=1 Tax=Plodia interpunctella TaxID=58824 RepID=UPI0023675A0F|nr:GILT-like protein 1 [Plodia interpunctella]